MRRHHLINLLRYCGVSWMVSMRPACATAPCLPTCLCFVQLNDVVRQVFILHEDKSRANLWN